MILDSQRLNDYVFDMHGASPDDCLLLTSNIGDNPCIFYRFQQILSRFSQALSNLRSQISPSSRILAVDRASVAFALFRLLINGGIYFVTLCIYLFSASSTWRGYHGRG
jgi:hypothetical protein